MCSLVLFAIERLPPAVCCGVCSILYLKDGVGLRGGANRIGGESADISLK